MKNFEVTTTSYIIADDLDIDCDDMSFLVNRLELSDDHITLCSVSRFVCYIDNMLKHYELVDKEKLIVVVQYLRDTYLYKHIPMNIAF